MHRIRLAAAAVMMAGLSSVAAAQGTDSTHHGGMPGMPHGRMGMGAMGAEVQRGRMWTQLMHGIELTDAQRAQLRTIHERYRAQHDSLAPTMRPGEGQRPDTAAHRQMMSLMQQERGEVRAVLTPAQQATFDQNAAAMREQMEERRTERREGMGGMRRAPGTRPGQGEHDERGSHSAFTLPSLITEAHLAISLRMNSEVCSGVV